MQQAPELSICVAIHNQANLFHDFVNSLGSSTRSENVEIVILDDGSTDNLEPEVAKLKAAGWRTRYHRQCNAGRAVALHRCIHLARGRWAIIMDGDDFFTANGLAEVLDAIRNFPDLKRGERPIVGIVFGVEVRGRLKLGGEAKMHCPPSNKIMSILSLRADYGLEGDLKEVVKLDVIKRHLWDDFLGFRRVPTSLLWARLSRDYDVVTSSKIVAVKRYELGGLSANIKKVKLENLAPIVEVHKERMRNRSYRSLRYRLRSQVNYFRYRNLNDRKCSCEGAHLFEFAGCLVGNLLGVVERLKIFAKRCLP